MLKIKTASKYKKEQAELSRRNKSHLYKPEYIAQLAAGERWRLPRFSIADSRLPNAPLRVPSRVVAVQHPGGDARQSQSEEHQRTEQLQHPPVVATSCRRLSRVQGGGGGRGGLATGGNSYGARITLTLTTDIVNRLAT